MRRPFAALFLALTVASALRPVAAQLPMDSARLAALKAEALTKVDARAKMIQEIIDQVFSYGELGMQEFETSKFLSGILEQNGFKVERGTAGMPTAWVARWEAASRSSRSAPTLTAFRNRDRSPPSPIATGLCQGHQVTAKGTTVARR